MIDIKDSLYDARDVKLGSTFAHDFVIKNTGNSELKVLRIAPSCGCTTAIIGDSIVGPGRSTILHTFLSTLGKVAGFTVKSIEVGSNAVNRPLSKIILKAHLVADSGHSAPMKVSHVFDSKCAVCHSERGKGLVGGQLFSADCAVCHSSPISKAPSLTAFRPLDSVRLRKIISEGKVGTDMPAFGREKGGPLTPMQIASLISYIRTLRAQVDSVRATHPRLRAPGSRALFDAS